MFLAHSPHECVHGFDLWKWPHDQRSGSCCNNNDNNIFSPAVVSKMMRSCHEKTTFSFDATASTDLCSTNPSSFDNSFQQAFNDGVNPLVMSFFPEMLQMKAHGELFKPTSLHGNSSYNNDSKNNTSNKTSPRTQSQVKFAIFNIKQ